MLCLSYLSIQCFTFRIKFTICFRCPACYAYDQTLEFSYSYSNMSYAWEGSSSTVSGIKRDRWVHLLWFQECNRLLRLQRREEIFVRRRAANSHIEQQDMPCDASSTVSPWKPVVLKSLKLPTTCKETSVVLLWGKLNFRGTLVFA